MRVFAYAERARRRTNNITDRHRHGLCNVAREKAGHKRSLKNEIYHLGQHGDTKKAEEKRRDGVLVRPRHRTTLAAVCVSKPTCTAYGKAAAEESKGKQKNGTTVRASPKRRNRSQEGKIVTIISVGLPREADNSRRKTTQEGNTKTLRAFPPVS